MPCAIGEAEGVKLGIALEEVRDIVRDGLTGVLEDTTVLEDTGILEGTRVPDDTDVPEEATEEEEAETNVLADEVETSELEAEDVAKVEGVETRVDENEVSTDEVSMKEVVNECADEVTPGKAVLVTLVELEAEVRDGGTGAMTVGNLPGQTPGGVVQVIRPK